MLQPIARVVRRHVQGTTLWIEAYVKHRMRDRTRNFECVFGKHRWQHVANMWQIMTNMWQTSDKINGNRVSKNALDTRQDAQFKVCFSQAQVAPSDSHL